MQPLELAHRYMEIFYHEGKFNELKDILHNDFKFRGPFAEYNTANDYVSALKKDPPKKSDYKIVRAFEDVSSACFLYEFTKPGVSTLMAQFFEIKEGKICSIKLIFDTGDFNN